MQLRKIVCFGGGILDGPGRSSLQSSFQGGREGGEPILGELQADQRAAVGRWIIRRRRADEVAQGVEEARRQAGGLRRAFARLPTDPERNHENGLAVAGGKNGRGLVTAAPAGNQGEKTEQANNRTSPFSHGGMHLLSPFQSPAAPLNRRLSVIIIFFHIHLYYRPWGGREQEKGRPSMVGNCFFYGRKMLLLAGRGCETEGLGNLLFRNT
jgi:hypothetical protein